MNTSQLLAFAVVLTAGCSNGPAQPDASTEGGGEDVVNDVSPPPDSGTDAADSGPTVNLACGPVPVSDAGSDADAGGSAFGSCITVDDAGISCNPMTNAPCNGDAGEACDFLQNGFQCYLPPPKNTAGICDVCDLENGPACAPGGTCVDVNNTGAGKKCGRFCCTAADCPSGAKCDTTFGAPLPIGICTQ